MGKGTEAIKGRYDQTDGEKERSGDDKFMKISPAQLRAARALLNWSRTELAKKAVVSEQTIHRFENGSHDSSPQTRLKLSRALEGAGVELIDNNGVRFKPKNIELFDGAARVDAFYDYVYEELLRCGGSLCAQFYDETVLRAFRKDPELHRTRMRDLSNRGLVLVRVLSTAGDFKTFGYIHYRRPRQQPNTSTGFYVFGECLALVSFVDKDEPHIIVLRSAPLAEGYRQNFETTWKEAEMLSPDRFKTGFDVMNELQKKKQS